MDARTMLSFDSDDDAVLYLSNKGRVMKFELDKVFPPPASQEEVGHMTTGRSEVTTAVKRNETLLSCVWCDVSTRCSRKFSLWSLPVSMALTSAYLLTDRPALGRRTPWRSADRF